MAERLAELLLVSGLTNGSGDSPAVADLVAVASLLSSHGTSYNRVAVCACVVCACVVCTWANVSPPVGRAEDHLEAWESMDLRRRLVQIANDPATDQTTR